MGTTQNIEEPVDISFLLMLKFKKPVVKLEELLPEYLPHLTLEQANKRANKCNLPFPAFKSDGVKSPFYVNLSDVVMWLQSEREKAKKDWSAMHG